MSASTLIAAKDLKLRVRDRSFFILGIAAPLVLATVFNFVFGNAFDASAGLGLEYGLVDLDQSQLSQEFSEVIESLEEEGLFTLQVFPDVSNAETAIEETNLDAFFLLPEGMSQAVFTGQSATIEVIGDIDAPTSTQIAASIADQFATGVDTTQLAIGTTAFVIQAPVTPEFIASLSRDPVSAAFSYQLSDVSAVTRQLDPVTYLAAGMAVFFLFFTVQFGVSGILEEDREGTLARLMAAPISRSAVIVGKALLAFALGAISMVVLVVATQLLLGATWGAPLGVALLVTAGVLSAVAIMGLIASVAKTPEGAGNLGAIIAVILGMLGGAFFPIGQGDDLLSKLTFITPHAWFLRGLGDLADDAPWTAALPATGAILAFALVFGSIAWALLRRKLSR